MKKPLSSRHHKRKIGFFYLRVGRFRNRFGRILTIQFIAILACLFFLIFFGVAYAQAPIHTLIDRMTKPEPITQSSTVLSPDIQEAIKDLAKDEIQQEQARALLAADSSITSVQTTADQTDQSPFQEIIETIQTITSTDPVVKAKAKIRSIDKLIGQLQNLLENDRSDQALTRGVGIIRSIGEQMSELAKDPKIQTDREVLALQIAQYNRFQLILQKIEDQLSLADALIIEDARQKYVMPAAVAGINAAPNLDALHNIAVKEIAKVVGEDFAELKAIEIISDFKEYVKPEAKEKLTGLEKELAREFEKEMLKFPRDARNRKLQNYIHYSFGNPLLQITSFNRIKNELSDREMILGISSLKEIAMEKLIERIFTLKDQKKLDQFTGHVMQNPEDLRTLAEMELVINAGSDNIRKEKFAQMRQSVLPQVAQFFNEKKFAELESYVTPDIQRPTDILDVLLVSNLVEIVAGVPVVSPEIKQALADLKIKTRERFAAEIAAKDFLTKSSLAYTPVSANADVRILLASPQGISLLQMIKQETKQADKAKIDIALKAQSAILQERLLVQVNDPLLFTEYSRYINAAPAVKQTLQQYTSPNFFINLSKKSQLIQKAAKANEQHLYEVIQQITQAIFITENTTDFERQLPTDIQEQVRLLKKDLPEKHVPQLRIPQGVTLPKIARLPASIEQAIIQAAKSRIKNKAKSEDVKLDLHVTAADLDVSDPWMLPDNPLYFLKNIARSTQLLFTFDPLRRLELLVRQNNERTVEAAKLIEKDSSGRAVNTALLVLADVQKDFSRLKENIAKLDELKKSQPEKVDQLVNIIIKNGLARQTVFSAISDKVYGADYVRVEKIRQSVLKDGIEALLRLTGGNVHLLVAKLETAVNTGTGSKFKEIKAIELLTEIKRFQPRQIDAILENSEIRLIKQFEAKLLNLTKQEREKDLAAYADSLPGNPVRQFQAYAQMKDSFDHPETALLISKLEDRAVENLREIISEITDAETFREFADEVVGNQPEDLKIITEIELRVDTPATIEGQEPTPIEQKIEEIKDLIEENIIDTYYDDPIGLSESELFSDPALTDNVSVVDVIVIDELNEVLERTPEVSPEVIEIVQALKEEITQEFIETVSDIDLSPAIEIPTSEELRVLEPIPAIIETLVELKEEASPVVDAQIDKAITVQAEVIETYLTTQVDSPETFETYLAQIEESPVVSDVVQVSEQTTTGFILTAAEEQTILETTVQQVENEIFSSPVSEPSTVEQTLPELIQEQITAIKQEIPTEQTTEIMISVETTITTDSVQTSPPVSTEPAVQETTPVEQPAAPASAESVPQTESVPAAPPAIPAL